MLPKTDKAEQFLQLLILLSFSEQWWGFRVVLKIRTTAISRDAVSAGSLNLQALLESYVW